MSELEEKLGAVLNDPQMMQQIFTMAQALGAQAPNTQAPAAQEAPCQDNGDPDFSMLRNLAGMVRQGRTDPNQQALLSALSPYLSRERVSKLEKAMQAARLAGAASSFLNAGGLNLLTGR